MGSTSSEPFSERGRIAHLAYRSTGSPVDLVFLHGFSDSAECWGPFIKALDDVSNKRWKSLAFDARGHGESGLPDDSLSHFANVADAVTVLEAIDAAARGGVVVIGHSMGAVVTSTVAAERPDLVRAIVLEDPPPEVYASYEGSPFQVPDWLREARSGDLVACMAACREREPAWPEDEIEPWAVSKRQLNMALFEAPYRPPHALLEMLGEMSCPVLLLHGDTERGSLISDAFAEECAAAAGGKLQAVHIEGAGHNVRRDGRAAFLSSVYDFLLRYA
mgnify:CR=1 FL=1